MHHNYILSLMFLLFTLPAFSQELQQYKWENRVIVLISDSDSEIVEKQLAELQRDPAGLVERKIVIYHILPDRYRIVWPETEEFSIPPDYDPTPTEGETPPFKVLLFGLDGTIKLEQTSLLSSRKLFATIDQMPMRRAEMEKDN